MRDFLKHFFTPHHSNNHRAKLLHSQSIFIAVIVFFIASVGISSLKTSFPDVLGVDINISSEELLSHTNKKRVEKGLSVLVLDSQLSAAAFEKAKDMFANNYWAHNSPTGTTPWVFIKKSGYTYTYAGENLARGFNLSDSVVNAWLASPSHRENMLSANYQDVGFAVVSGKLNGEETVLVVEMFGGKKSSVLAQQPATPPLVSSGVSSVQGEQTVLSSVFSNSLINSNSLTKNISIIALGMFIFTLLLDMIIIERRKIIRIVGHNTDHILFLGAIIIFIILISRGVIL